MYSPKEVTKMLHTIMSEEGCPLGTARQLLYERIVREADTHTEFVRDVAKWYIARAEQDQFHRGGPAARLQLTPGEPWTAAITSGRVSWLDFPTSVGRRRVRFRDLTRRDLLTIYNTRSRVADTLASGAKPYRKAAQFVAVGQTLGDVVDALPSEIVKHFKKEIGIPEKQIKAA